MSSASGGEGNRVTDWIGLVGTLLASPNVMPWAIVFNPELNVSTPTLFDERLISIRYTAIPTMYVRVPRRCPALHDTF
ncbi:hypothetical protein V6N13_119055 [Hibiscus sabdariffa]